MSLNEQQIDDSTPRWRELAKAWALPVGLVLLWWLATNRHWVNTRLIVPPAGVLIVGWHELAQADFYVGIGLSLWRDVAGLAMGASLGVLVGTLMGVSRWADRLLGPTFHTARQISLFAWLPLLSAMVGTGDTSKVIFIAFSAFYPVVLGTLEGVQGVSQAHADVAQVLRFSTWQWLTRLVWPSATPQILTGLRLGVIYAWLATIGAEFLLVNDGQGLGNIVFKGRMAFNVELIIFGLVAIGLIGHLFHRAANLAEDRLLRWRAPAI